MFFSIFIFSLTLSSIHSIKQCDNIIPGITRMSRGVDITTLDLFPMDFSHSNGFRAQVFQLTCNENRLWKHPSTLVSYQLPDQVESINTIPGGAINMNTQRHDDLDQYKRQLAHKVGLNGKLGLEIAGSFSGSPSYQTTQEQMLKSNKTAVETTAHVSALQVDFNSDLSKLTLHPNFKKFIRERLVREFEENEDIYEEFLNKFGTHYFEFATFGGYLHLKTLVENDYIYRTEPQVVSANIEASFMGVVGVKPDGKLTHNKGNTEFETNTESKFYYYGGIVDLKDSKNNDGHYTRWANSVIKDPWLFGGQVRNIDQLIDDERVAIQVRKAVQLRRARAYFHELKHSLDFSGIELTVEDQERIAGIEDGLFASNGMPKNVTLLMTQIEHYFKIFHRIKDRFLLKDLLGRLSPVHESIVPCKHLLSMVCDSPSATSFSTIDYELRHFFYRVGVLYDKYTLPSFSPKAEQIEKIKDKVVDLLRTHWNQKVAICEGYEPCVECLENIHKSKTFRAYKKCFTPSMKNLIREFNESKF